MLVCYLGVFVTALVFVDALMVGVFVKFILFLLYTLDYFPCCFQQLTIL